MLKVVHLVHLVTKGSTKRSSTSPCNYSTGILHIYPWRKTEDGRSTDHSRHSRTTVAGANTSLPALVFRWRWNSEGPGPPGTPGGDGASSPGRVMTQVFDIPKFTGKESTHILYIYMIIILYDINIRRYLFVKVNMHTHTYIYTLFLEIYVLCIIYPNISHRITSLNLLLRGMLQWRS